MPETLEQRRGKDFDQFNPPKDITNPGGPTDPAYPAHVHKVNDQGEYAMDYLVVTSDEERIVAAKKGYHKTPDAAIAAHAAKRGKSKDE